MIQVQITHSAGCNAIVLRFMPGFLRSTGSSSFRTGELRRSSADVNVKQISLLRGPASIVLFSSVTFHPQLFSPLLPLVLVAQSTGWTGVHFGVR